MRASQRQPRVPSGLEATRGVAGRLSRFGSSALGAVFVVLTTISGAGDVFAAAIQDPPVADVGNEQEQPVQLEDVTVTRQSLQRTVEAFVDEVAAPTPGRSLSRWDRGICVGAANLRREAAQVIVDRVSAIAAEVGLQPGEPGCSPNILVIASDDANGLSQALVEARPTAFRPPYAGAAGSRRTLAAFATTTRPIRWWYVSLPVHRDTGAIAVRLPGEIPPRIATLGGRLTTDVRYDLRRTFVILDMTLLEGLTFQQVGDYVAMVSLAQIDPDAQTESFDSILNVFNLSVPDASLTGWDLAYLRSLYAAELNRRNPRAQEGEVGDIMVRDRQAEDDNPDD